VYNSANRTLERFYQGPADYNESTYQTKQICLDNLSDCRFNYSDGKAWLMHWEEDMGQIPKAIKIYFKFSEEEQEREFIVNIPISP
jgi:hypothetical protein